MELTPKQAIALTHLVAGATNGEAAKAAGVSKRSVEAWKALPEFKKHLKVAVNQMLDESLAELVLGSKAAVKELNTIIADEETPTRTKLSAISILLSNAAKVRDWYLEERLESIESALDGETDSAEN
jgi:hypothetical protein